MARPLDPTVLSAMERLLTVSGATPSRVPRFREGTRGSDLVGHLLLETQPAFDFIQPGVPAELFLSRQGTQLLRLAEEQRRTLGVPGAASGADLFIFAEVPSRRIEAVEAPDTLSGQVFEVVTNPNAERVRIELGATDILFFAPTLPSVLGYQKREFESKVRHGIAETRPSVLATATSKALEVVAIFADLISAAANGVATFLKENSRMPEGLWNPKKRPGNWKGFVEALGDRMDSTISTVREGINGFRVDFAEKLAKIPGFDMFPLLEETVARISSDWNRVIDFLGNVMDSIVGIKSSTAGALNAVLGFVCGLWDGVMDAVAGIFEMVGLAARLIAGLLRSLANVERAVQMIREAADEILQALHRIDWVRLWNWLLRASPHLWNAAKERTSDAFDRIVSDTAQAGYYFGYLVYMVIEFFLPPLKLSSLARSARRLQGAAFFAKVFV